MHIATRRLVGALLVVVLGLAGAACEEESAGPEVGADIEDVQVGDIAGDAEAFVGQIVSVSGRVTEVVGVNAFELSGDDVAGDAVLVVSAEETDVGESQLVQVTGEVTADFVVVDAEEDLGIDLADDDFESFLSENYVVATDVQVLEDVDDGAEGDTTDGATPDGDDTTSPTAAETDGASPTPTPTGEESPTAMGGQAAPPELEGPVNDQGTATLEGDSIPIHMTDFAFDPTFVQHDQAKIVTVELENTGQTAHTFTIEGQDVDVVVQPGDTASVDVELTADGSTRFICRFHVGQGMQGAFYSG